MLKSYGWWGGGRWVALVIIVSAQGPNPSFSFFFLLSSWGLLFDLGACWDTGLDLDLDQGLTKILVLIFQEAAF